LKEDRQGKGQRPRIAARELAREGKTIEATSVSLIGQPTDTGCTGDGAIRVMLHQIIVTSKGLGIMSSDITKPSKLM
jgi:hypothetical protein